MAIDTISAVTTGSSLNNSNSTIAENFDTFLGLLTTQLQNQNPLDPLDTNQFTSQMVEFTSVEQQLKTNEYLEALTLSNAATTYTQSVSFIGKEVTAAGSTTELVDSSATWSYSSDRDAPNSVVSILDSSGNSVYTETADLGSGDGQFQWDGRDSSGNQLPDGTYTINIDARDDIGVIPMSTSTTGIVTAVELSGNQPVLVIGNSRISMTDITSVAQA